MILLARFTDETRTQIKAVTTTGKVLIIPADENNRHYRMIRYGDDELDQEPVPIEDPE